MSNLLDLTEDNLLDTQTKFAEEIDELQAALKEETNGANDPAVKKELQEAIQQSNDLLEELEQVILCFDEARETGRELTKDECDAFKYFGFKIPADRKVAKKAAPPPPAPTPAPTKIELPPTTTPTTARVSEAPETETDVEAMYNRFPLREMTPEEALPSAPASPQPPKPVMAQPIPVDPEVRAREIAQQMVNAERLKLQAEYERKLQSAVASAHVVDQRALAEKQEAHNREVAELTAEISSLKTEVMTAKAEAANERREKEEKIRLLNVAKVEAEESRREASLMRQRLDGEDTERIAASLRAKSEEARNTRAEWLDFVSSSLKSETLTLKAHVEQLSAENEKLRQTIEHDVARLEARIDSSLPRSDRNNESQTAASVPVDADGQTTEAALAAAQEALALNERLHSSPHYTAEGGDELDRMVAHELASMGFPTPVVVQRLGPHGDYYIDRRVQLKVIDGRVMVKRAGHNSNAYDPLTAYLLHLYAPFFGMDTNGNIQQGGYGALDLQASPVPTAPHLSAVDGPERVRQLQQEQRMLAEELARQEVLATQAARGGAMVSPARHANPDNINAFLQRSQRQRVQEAIMSPPATNRAGGRGIPAVVTAPAAVKRLGATPVSSMSEEEVELLKKLALAKQIRESRREQNIAGRYR